MSEQYERDDVTPQPRLVARKLLRVSGSRVGSLARPAASGDAAVAPRAPRLGLRVNGRSLASLAGAPTLDTTDDTP